jgi:hypothetical protein
MLAVGSLERSYTVTSVLRDQLQATLGASYTLEHELGGGGMSRVFAAMETSLELQPKVAQVKQRLARLRDAERH